MIKSLATLAVVAAVVAGCGSSSSSSSTTAAASSAPSSSSTTATSTPSSTATSSSAPSSTSTPSGGAGLSSNPTVQAAVATCKQRIAAAPNLSSDAKNKLNNLCDQAASGNEAGVLKAAAQVCQEIVKQSIPQAEQQQMLASCPKG